MTKTIKAFNAGTQQTENAVISVNGENEFLVTFKDKSFFKMPATFTAQDIKDYLIAYEEANKGQISAADVEKEKVENESKLDELDLVDDTEEVDPIL